MSGAGPTAEPTRQGDGAPLVVAAIDVGASALRLVVAEIAPNQPVRILEQASRAVSLGRDTFGSGRLGAANVEAALKALEGFRKIMDSYDVRRCRAVATSAVREAENRDNFIDRVQLRTGIELEIVDGSEENRLSYLAVREHLRQDPALGAGVGLLVGVGGGSADLSLLRDGDPVYSGTYPLGAIRLRQSLSSWHGSQEQRMRLLRRHIHNVVDDIRREIPLADVQQFIALGGDVRYAVARLDDKQDGGPRHLSREQFLALSESLASGDPEELVTRDQFPVTEAETLVPALLVYSELLQETKAANVTVVDASLRAGLLLDLAQTEAGQGVEAFGSQALASAAALGEKYRYDVAHARNVAYLAARLFDQLRAELGLGDRQRLLLQVAALLHDIGIFVSLRAHHKHSHYLLSVSEVFGLTQEDMALIANVARYHRRALPQRTHLPFTALDRDARIQVSKLGALLRLANALDADHLQKVSDVKALGREGREDEGLVIEIVGVGDLTLERLVASSRSDLLSEILGRRVTVRDVSAP
jgi:exopolyphosphatase / guanosine-5'-triphosphate,3'-diphosphate pyrophosphatase